MNNILINKRNEFDAKLALEISMKSAENSYKQRIEKATNSLVVSFQILAKCEKQKCESCSVSSLCETVHNNAKEILFVLYKLMK